MPNGVTVVKRRGRKENFDERKVYASVYSACMSAYHNEIKCEKSAERITGRIRSWLKVKKFVTSTEIRKKIKAEIKKVDKRIEFHYDKHIPNLSKL